MFWFNHLGDMIWLSSVKYSCNKLKSSIYTPGPHHPGSRTVTASSVCSYVRKSEFEIKSKTKSWWVLLFSQKEKEQRIQKATLSIGDTSQNTQWMPKTTDTTPNPIYTKFFLYLHTFSLKGNTLWLLFDIKNEQRLWIDVSPIKTS